MIDEEIIEMYKPMVSFIAEIYGENCEVLLHDLKDLTHSIVAIENNHITFRDVNGTITDFGLEIVNKYEKYKDKKFITNYMGKTKDGSKTLRSSTYFIRNNEEELIGLLCVNIDITALKEARKSIDKLLFMNIDDNEDNYESIEEFSSDIEELVEIKVKRILDKYNIHPSRMTHEEKRQVVNELNENGVFLIKGVTKEVADKLKVSVQTIYRYLNEL